MEHIVQFGISIDDEMIKKTVEKNAMSVVTQQIKDECIEVLVDKTDSIWKTKDEIYKDKIKNMIDYNIQEFMNNNKEKIIELASENLANRLIKTKAVKEAVGDKIKELQG